jgi:5-exo-hydroxycamphor dehydrogenase
MHDCRRAVLVTPGSPIEVWDGSVPTATGGDVVVSVEMAGVCGTDHHLAIGDIPLPGAIVLGHEGIGRIEELGPDVSTDYAGDPIEVGDLVYWLPVQPCHRCYACNIMRDPAMCPNLLSGMFRAAEEPPSATYAEYAWLPDGMAFFRVPPDTPPEAVIAFGCAMPTMLNAMERLGGIEYGQHVVVQGCGPVGLAATLLAHLGGAGTITVIGAPERRLEMARQLGATLTLDLATTDEDDRVAAVMEQTGGRGAQAVIEAAGHLSAFPEGLRLVAQDGTYLVVGLWSAPGTTSVEPRAINNANVRIVGSALESPRHIYQAIQVARMAHRRFPLVDVVSHRFALDETQDALDAVGRAEPIKAVIQPVASALA